MNEYTPAVAAVTRSLVTVTYAPFGDRFPNGTQEENVAWFAELAPKIEAELERRFKQPFSVSIEPQWRMSGYQSTADAFEVEGWDEDGGLKDFAETFFDAWNRVA